MEDIISHIVEEWFLTEPLLFSAWCTHTLAENTKMYCPMRTGKMRSEYNPNILKDWDKDAIEDRLRFEVIRILLGHPYQRQPYKAKKATLGIASDVAICSNYHKIRSIQLPKGLRYDRGLCFEEYYAIVQAYLDQLAQQCNSPTYDMEGFVDDGGGGASDDAECNSQPDSHPDGDNEDKGVDKEACDEPLNPNEDEYEKDVLDEGEGDDTFEDNEPEDEGSGENEEDDGGGGTDDPIKDLTKEAEDKAELWEEDQLASEQVKEVVRRAQRSKQWGSVAGGLKDEIEATTIVRIDYRTILSGFRASVLCSKRRLTRMIPSRRYGFQYMGSKRDFATRLLVAIDVSGSVDDKQVAQALSIINRFFKYGVENVDVILFDVALHGEVMSMKKAQKSIKIEGRGGTSFQEPIDYFLDNHYDGLIMITDGYAPKPELPKAFYGNILWMLYNDEYFRNNGGLLPSAHQWIAELPKNKFTILPPV